MDYLANLSEYYFNRDDFVNTFRKVFTGDEFVGLEVACQSNKNLYDNEFILYCANETYYIIHLGSGTIISWYKHLGRCNTCNKDGFSLNDLEMLLIKLKESLPELE